MNMPTEPIAAISEPQASGETAALFADIRQTLGVPVVNLIFRHLATLPNALPWCWQTLRPVYVSGVIDGQASALRNALPLPAVDSFGVTRLRESGVSDQTLSTVSMILRSYERSNSMNLIAFSALVARLRGEQIPANSVLPETPSSPRVDGEMPIPLDLSELNEELHTLVLRVAAIGGRDTIMPTMYRHLAHWPDYLALVAEFLTPLDERGVIRAGVISVLRDSQERGVQIGAQLGQAEVILDSREQELLIRTINNFTHDMIAKMIVIVGLIRQAMPADD